MPTNVLLCLANATELPGDVQVTLAPKIYLRVKIKENGKSTSIQFNLLFMVNGIKI